MHLLHAVFCPCSQRLQQLAFFPAEILVTLVSTPADRALHHPLTRSAALLPKPSLLLNRFIINLRRALYAPAGPACASCGGTAAANALRSTPSLGFLGNVGESLVHGDPDVPRGDEAEDEGGEVWGSCEACGGGGEEGVRGSPAGGEVAAG